MRIAAFAVGVILLAACSGDRSDRTASSGKECEATVHVFLQVGTTSQRERRVGVVIAGIPSVLQSKFHSNLEAYREFKNLYKKRPKLYELKKPADFPSRYEVTLDSGQSLAAFQRALDGATTGIDRVVPGGCRSPEPTR